MPVNQLFFCINSSVVEAQKGINHWQLARSFPCVSNMWESTGKRGGGMILIWGGRFFDIMVWGGLALNFKAVFCFFKYDLMIFPWLHALSRHPLFWHHSPIFMFSIWLTRLGLYMVVSYPVISYSDFSYFVAKFESVRTQVWISLYPNLSQFVPKFESVHTQTPDRFIL